MPKAPQDLNMSQSSDDSGSNSSKSWKDGDELTSNQSIEMLAIRSQLKTAQTEIMSLQRRNQDLELAVREKECLLADVI